MLKWIKHLFRTRTEEERREAEFYRLYLHWSNDCRARGLSPAQKIQEFQFRVAWVRFRRRVNEAAIAWPEGYRQKLSEIARDEANKLALTDKAVAKQFLKVVESSNALSEILYPDGMRAVMAYKPPIYISKIEDDHFDALRTR